MMFPWKGGDNVRGNITKDDIREALGLERKDVKKEEENTRNIPNRETVTNRNSNKR